MKTLKNIKIIQNSYFRILFEVVISVAIALLLELAVNLPALTQGYQPFHVTDFRVTKKGRLIYTQEFEEAVYINKIKIQGSFAADLTYDISLTALNDFGLEETIELEDQAYAVFHEAYTRIGEKVKAVTVTFPKAAKVEIDEITILNGLDISKYRILFWMLVCFLVLLLCFESGFIVQKTEWFYAVFALGFGILLISASGPRATTWDEEVHYSLVYRINLDSETMWSHAAWQNSARFTPDVNTREELEMLKTYMNQQGELEWYAEPKMPAGFKNIIVYLPMIIAQWIGSLLNFPYIHLYNAGRVGNLLFCILFLFFSIRLAKRKKVLIAVTSLMPTVLFQSSMYTYDGVIFACMMLGFVLWMNEFERSENEVRMRNMVYILLLFAVGSVAKPIYIPFFLLMIPLVSRMVAGKQNKRRIVILISGIVFAGIILAGLYLIPILTSMSSGNLSYGGDLRGGETGIAAQWISIVEHPADFFKMLIHEIFTLDNFRNFSAQSKNKFMIGNLMFLNLYALGMLKDAWSMLLIPMFVILVLAEPEWEPVSEKAFRKSVRKINAVVVILCVILTWIIMYLTFTPIGYDAVEGVQARYYLPLILPVAYAVWNDSLRVYISKVRYYQIVLGMTLLLSGTCFYQCLIMNRTV